MGATTRSQITNENTEFYSKTLLVRALPRLVHNRWAQVRDIPANGGTDKIRFRRYGSLTKNTTALSEGVTPAGKQLSITNVEATIAYYGDYVTLTDKVSYETKDPILTETADVLGEQAGNSLDHLCRDVIAATTTVQYAGSATARSEIDSGHKVSRDEIKKAVRTLKGNKARPITSRIDPNTGYNTIPLNAAFVAIVDEDTAFDLDDAEGWTPVEKYPNKSDVMDGEIGSVAGVRFVETTNAKTYSGTLVTTVHTALVLAQHAYGITRLSGKSMQNIVKPLGSAGTADPLNQRSTSGWKATFVAKILNENFLLKLEHAVSS